MENNNDKIFFKSSEVAKMFGITVATLKKLVLTDQIECTLINNHRYFTKESIDNFTRTHSNNTTEKK